MATFLLIHGAWHGAWAFEHLLPLLPGAVAVDLPCDDPSAGLDVYARVAAEAAPPGDDVIVVGSSLGGLTVPLVAQLRPVRGLVYLNAFVPDPGQPMTELLEPGVPGIPPGAVHRDGDTSTWTDFPAYHRAICADATKEQAWAAFARLRPQARKPQVEPSPLTRHPDVPTTCVISARDVIMPPDYCRRSARRIGVEPVELPGDHYPALTRPRELADLLLSLA